MKALQPRVSNVTGWHATARPLFQAPRLPCLVRQLQGTKADSATQVSGAASSRHFVGPKETTHQASPRRPLNRGPASLQHSTGYIPSRDTRDAVRTRGSYSTEATVAGEPTIHDVFEEATGTWQYIVADPSTSAAVIIDPVLDYDPVTQAVTTQTADSLLSILKDNGYKVDMILETHAHADHLTAASYLQHRLSQEQGHRPSIGIGKRIPKVQKLFGGRYQLPSGEYVETVFDKLFDDDETFKVGNLTAMALHLPGHTPDHLGYKIGDNVFCGDSVFHFDIGTARCDFPGGSAKDLFKSGRRLLSLPNDVKIWTGHDYPPEGRVTPQACMTVQQHRERNKHLMDSITEDAFVEMRQERDKTLGAPRLLHQSLQMNIQAGKLPKPNDAGLRLLHLPLKLQVKEW